jgi:predicted aspartyl protease
MQVRSINSVHANKPYHVDLKISNEDLRFKIDTGADETIISLEDYNKENLLGRPALEQLRIVKWKENRLQIQKHISQIQTQEFQQEVFKKYPKLFHGIGN